MKKEMKIILPVYKMVYAFAFVVILSLIRGVVFTNEIGLSIEGPFAILIAVFCADTYVQEITSNRSEAIRDILRSALAQEATQQHGTQGFAVLSYVYEHEKRDLASRIVSTQHHHHDLSVATLHVHINHDDCLEIAVLKGDMGDVQHFADDVIAQRGVRHGHLQCLPKED